MGVVRKIREGSFVEESDPPLGSNAHRVLYGQPGELCTTSCGHFPSWHHFNTEDGVPARVCKHCLAEQHAIPIDYSTRRVWVAI